MENFALNLKYQGVHTFYIGYMQRDPLVINAPYELWREDGILHLILNRTARIGMHEIKEILRIIKALDPVNASPVIVLSEASATITNDARRLLQRSCKGELKRRVAYVADSLSNRVTGDLFALLNRPTFPFKVFGSSNDAFRWFERKSSVHR